MPSTKPTSVLDASALMAHLNEETGATVVEEAMSLGAAISVANWAEVLSKAAAVGEDPQQLADDLRDALIIEPITDADCVEIAKLLPITMPQGLSLADRACVVLAARLGVPALTSDTVWAQADTDAEITLIR